MALWTRKSSQTKILPLKDIIFDESIYPRQSSWWATSYKYAEEMKAGAKFPPITVGMLDGKHVLVDGKHRQDALTMNKETHFQANVLYGYTKDELYIEAVKLNRAHGVGLTPYDKVKIIRKLSDLKYELKDIAEIVQVPLENITQFVANRITLTPISNDSSSFSQGHILKSPLKHLAGTSMIVSEEEQNTLSVSSELNLVTQMKQIFSNPKLIRIDERFVKEVFELYQLLSKFLDSWNRQKLAKESDLKVTF